MNRPPEEQILRYNEKTGLLFCIPVTRFIDRYDVCPYESLPTEFNSIHLLKHLPVIDDAYPKPTTSRKKLDAILAGREFMPLHILENSKRQRLVKHLPALVMDKLWLGLPRKK